MSLEKVIGLVLLGLVSCSTATKEENTATINVSQKSKDVDRPFHHRFPGRINPADHTGKHRRHVVRLSQLAAASLSANLDIDSSNHIINPCDFGADPFGLKDSSTALALAVKNLTSLGTSRNDQGMIDLGGAIFDLSGGVYAIHEPLLFPEGYANFKIQRGTLKATSQFVSGEDTYMLQVGNIGACNATSGGNNNKDCNSDVGIQQLTLEGQGYAWGALLVGNTMDANIGPAIMVTGFTGVGISLGGTGAGYIHECWLGQYPAGDKTPRSNATATAILLAGAQHDCDVNNVIIFSGRVGVNSTNGANRIQGVHTWNLNGHDGGTGILLHGGTGRVQQCYLDYAPLVIRVWNPGGVTLVEGNFFLGSANVVLVPSHPSTILHGLVMTGNVFGTWNSANKTFVIDESSGRFSAVKDTVIENNEVNAAVSMAGKLSSRATMTKAIGKQDSCTFNFSSALVFDDSVGINPASVVCYVVANVVTSFYTTVTGNHVTLVWGAVPASDGIVTCTVDQSVRTDAAH
eukprot:m.134151 g.134151  ORF g.134151 m.134151 type:complete len:518 (-) comp29723_c0_seq1:297-1850(-)